MLWFEFNWLAVGCTGERLYKLFGFNWITFGCTDERFCKLFEFNWLTVGCTDERLCKLSEFLIIKPVSCLVNCLVRFQRCKLTYFFPN